MKLSLEDVRHVAKLARLELSSDEETRYGQQLSDVLSAVEALSQVDVSGVEATSHPLGSTGFLREDVAETSDAAETIVPKAPASSGTSFLVPRVIE